jgi:23S rRNA (adenine2503-C2)-methyltransferase
MNSLTLDTHSCHSKNLKEILPDALNLSLEEWQVWCEDHSLPKFVGKQIFSWIFSKQVLDPMAFTNVPAPLRSLLLEKFRWDLPKIESHLISKDGSEKFLLKTSDGLLYEMVLMPYHNRSTLCVSSQVGCRMGCSFCQTGKMGLKRNLRTSEILAQLILANRALANENHAKTHVTNVVFMGMGEPLDNYDNVVKACRLMVDPLAFGLSKSRVTISTSGLVPQIIQLGKDLPIRLAISLHSADDTARSKMMPINNTYNLAELKQALVEYPASKYHGITFEYVMMEGKNDSLDHAKMLIYFLHGLKAKVNLIPLNHFPGIPLTPSSAERIQAFQDYLTARSIPAPVRYSRGQDISGACGQLAAKRQDELTMDPRQLHRQRRFEERQGESVTENNS